MKKIVFAFAAVFSAVSLFAAVGAFPIQPKMEGEGEIVEQEPTDTVKLDVAACSAFYFANKDDDFGGGAQWRFNLYKDYNSETQKVTYPDVWLYADAKSKTALNGTYNVYPAEVILSEKDTVEAESLNIKLTVKRISEKMYAFKTEFIGSDNKVYTLDVQVECGAFDADAGSEHYPAIELTDPIGGGEQAIDNTTLEQSNEKAIKIMQEGQLLIVRDGKVFNAMGTCVQ